MNKSALRVMNLLWDKGDMSAKALAAYAKERYGWNKNTTYTIVNRCIKGGLIERMEPGFLCRALIPKRQIQESELNSLLDDLFQGVPGLLLSTLANSRPLSGEDVEELRRLISKLE